MKTIFRFLGRTATAFLATVGVLAAFGLLIGLMEQRTQRLLLSAFGWMGVVVTGLVGTPVHELGHYLGCRIFGLRVTEMALFRPVAGRIDGVLGYVGFTYDTGSVWQRLGCFFAGVAPLLFGTAVILLLVWLLTPEVYRSASGAVSTALRKTRNPLRVAAAAAGGYLRGFGSLRGFGVVRGMLSLYLICSVSMHMSLSMADLQGASAGVLLILLACGLFSAVTMLVRIDVRKALARTASVLSLLLGTGLLFCLLCAGLSYLMTRIF
ncbi:MAG: hypothetical protein VB055_09160 [Oscillospiraceae bacterium]|nr:hypothetical protein [Oscillospiraceae bacterium]